jgi:hypothetical protein
VDGFGDKMAITLVDIASPSNLNQYTDTSIGNAVDGIKASSAVLYSVFVDNSANVGAAAYVKIFNLGSVSVVLGTTAPDEIIYVPAGAIISHFLMTAAVAGKTFGTALSAACVTAGGTAGVVSPASSVKATFNFV